MRFVNDWKLLWPMLLLAPALLLFAQWGRMWQLEQYQYMPALVIALGLLIYSRWDGVARGPSGILAHGSLSCGVLVLLGTVILPLPWLAVFGWLLIIGAAFGSNCERDGQTLLPIWPLTWLLITLPLDLDQSLTRWLQSQSSRVGSYLLDTLSVPHMLLGNVIELPDHRLFVEEACSGVQSVFTLLFLATLLVVGLRRGSVQLPLYWAAAVFWALLMNITRILTIAYVRDRFGLDWASGWRHAMLGYFTLLVATLLLLSTDRLFRVLFFPTNPEKESGYNPLVALWNYLTSPAIQSRPRGTGLTGKVGLGVVALAVVVMGGHLVSASGQANSFVAFKQDETPIFAPPERLTLEGFVQTGREHLEGSIDMPFGLDSEVYRGTLNGLPITIAVSQTYPSWHDLCECYSGIGWKLNERELLSPSSAIPCDWVAARWLGPNSEYGYLAFSGFDDKGLPVRAKRYTLLERFQDRIAYQWQLQSINGRVAMVQVFCESTQPLDITTVADLQKAHHQVRQQFVDVAAKK